MTQIKMNPTGQIALPPEICQRHGFKPTTPIRIIETRSGVLLVPLTKEPMDEKLARSS